MMSNKNRVNTLRLTNKNNFDRFQSWRHCLSAILTYYNFARILEIKSRTKNQTNCMFLSKTKIDLIESEFIYYPN